MFKKTLIAAAALTAFSTAAIAADASGEVYGDFRYSIDQNDAQGAPADLNFNGNNSHVGLKAAAKEGDYSVGVTYERFLGNDTATAADGVRQSYITIGSPFGTLDVGTAATAYKKAGEALDPFFNSGVNNGIGTGGASFGLSGLVGDTIATANAAGFVQNQVAYTSPSFGGITVNAAMFADDATADRHDYALGLAWTAGAISVGVQSLNINGAANFGTGVGTGTATMVHGAYTAKSWGAGAGYESLDPDGGAATDQFLLSGWYGLTDSTRVAAVYGNVDAPGAAPNDSITLGAFHNLTKSLETYVAVAKNTNAGVNNDVTNISVGFNFDFGMKVGK